MTVENVEARLNDFDPVCRKEALFTLIDLCRQGRISLPEPRPWVNLHCHTFFSYNGYGYSPSFIAWRARREGLMMAGVVDFDVLDAADEFLEACGLLDLRGCAGIETRVFLPEYATQEINSPGERGIAYHMGVGFATGKIAGCSPDGPSGSRLLDDMRAGARRRNEGIVSRVNAFLKPVELDYERDVLPLTPNGNATERHLCAAYAAKSAEVFPDDVRRAEFWAGRLGGETRHILSLFADPPQFQGLVRSKTMKAGGPGYVTPEGPEFPRLEDVNAFVLAAGAIPTFAWLDGASTGEGDIEALLDAHQATGSALVNIIPDRNWNIKDPAVKKTKVANLYRVVEVAQRRGLPIVVGTEMNAPGQRFVDDFDAPELEPLVPLFLEGAYTVYAHTVLQRRAGMGYCSQWAREHIPSVTHRNTFYTKVGEALTPHGETARLSLLKHEMTPEEIARLLAIDLP